MLCHSCLNFVPDKKCRKGKCRYGEELRQRKCLKYSFCRITPFELTKLKQVNNESVGVYGGNPHLRPHSDIIPMFRE